MKIFSLCTRAVLVALLGVAFLPILAQAQSCSGDKVGTKYICEPVANPLPAGCIEISGKMGCDNILPGYMVVNKAVLVSFKAPPKLLVGITASITWETKFAANCSIGGTPVDPTGSLSVSVQKDTTFTLKCQDTTGINMPTGSARDLGSVTIAATTVQEVCPDGGKPMTVGEGMSAKTMCVPECAAGQKVSTTTVRGGGLSFKCVNDVTQNTNTPVTTQEQSSKPSTLSYQPLEPLPGFEEMQDLNFAQFLATVFKILVSIGAMLSVVTLVYAGVSYVLSEAFETKGEAKNRMKAALFGMIILIGAWLLLNTINPALLNFDLGSIGTIQGTTPEGVGQNSVDTKNKIDIAEKNACESGPNPGSYEQKPGGGYICKK